MATPDRNSGGLYCGIKQTQGGKSKMQSWLVIILCAHVSPSTLFHAHQPNHNIRWGVFQVVSMMHIHTDWATGSHDHPEVLNTIQLCTVLPLFFLPTSIFPTSAKATTGIRAQTIFHGHRTPNPIPIREMSHCTMSQRLMIWCGSG